MNEKKLKIFLTILFACCILSSFAQTREKYEQIIDSFTKTEQTQKLIPYFLKELKTKPKNEDVLRALGFLYSTGNQPDIGEKYFRDAIAVNPKCASCYMNIGRLYAQKSDTNKALEYFDKAVNLQPDNIKLYLARAQLKDFVGDQFGALADYNKAIEIDPKNADSYTERGLYNAKQNYFPLALADLNKAVELAPDNYRPYYERAGIYYEQKMMKEALVDINASIALDSSQERLFTVKGFMHAFLNEHEKAVADFTKAIQLNPKHYLPYYHRSLSKYKLEDMDGSCADRQQSLAILNKYEPKNPLKEELEYSIGNYCDASKASYYYQRGIAFYNLQKFDDAVEIYTKGVQKFPNNSMMLSFRGNAYFSRKDYAAAINDYYASIQNKNNLGYDIEANQRHTGLTGESIGVYVNGFIAVAQLSIAESKFALGDYKQALIEINKAIDIAPVIKEIELEIYYNVRGNIFLALGKNQEALDDFNTAIQKGPSFPLAYVNRAIAEINLDSKVAVRSYSIRGGINNQNFNANWTLPLKTSIKNSRSNIFSALADCNKAIELEPNLDFAYYIRGQIRKMLSYDNACADLKKAKELGYPVEESLMKDCGK